MATAKRPSAAHVDRRERDLTPEQNERVREFVIELRKRYPSQKALGDDIGLTQSGVSSLLIGKSGTSHAVAIRVAKLLGLRREDVIGETDEMAEPIVDHLPNRARLRATDVWQQLPERVQRELLAIDFKRATDKPFSWWLGEAARRLEMHEEGITVDPTLEDADPRGER